MSTREEKIANLTEIRKQAEAHAAKYNEQMHTGLAKDALKTEELLKEAISEYTDHVRTLCFEDCLASGNPLMAAAKAVTYVTIARKNVKTEDDEIPVCTIIDKERQIELLKLHEYCRRRVPGSKGIGADPNWVYMAQKVNMILTARSAEKKGIDPTEIRDNFVMNEIAKQMDMGKTPTSNTQILNNNLRPLIAAMMGEEYRSKTLSHDSTFLMESFTKHGREIMTVTTATEKQFASYLLEICAHVAYGRPYGVECKQCKKK